MGCFKVCFFSTKLWNSRKKLSTFPSIQERDVTRKFSPPKKTVNQEIARIPKDKNEEQCSGSGLRGRLTIDLSVRPNEKLPILQVTNCFVENEKENEERQKAGEDLLKLETKNLPPVENEEGKKKEIEVKEETRNQRGNSGVENEEKCKRKEVKEVTRNERESCLVENEGKVKEKGMKEERRNERENCSGEIEGKEKEEEEKKETRNERETQFNSSVASIISCSPVHRYHNCTSNGDKFCEDMDLEKIKCDEDVAVDCELIQEDSSELFSLSIESRKLVGAVENDDKEVISALTNPNVLLEEEAKAMELNEDAKYQGQCIDLEMKPVENLDQKHEEKENINMEKGLGAPFSQEANFRFLNQNSTQKAAHQKPQCQEMMENIHVGEEFNRIPFSEEPNFKSLTQKSKKRSPQDQENAVDTSLSSWLVESEKTPNTKTNSPSSFSIGISTSERTISSKCIEERPILGELTGKELKGMLASSSPRRSPGCSHSPDNIPIIGTVGSYWKNTRQTCEFKLGLIWQANGKYMKQVPRGSNRTVW